MCALQAPTNFQTQSPGDVIINDFAFSVATANGSGSQTSNNVLVQTLFNMGIPVNGKNLFPSNIKGLPTWYTIRASKDGYTARRATTEIVVAYNSATVVEDVHDLPSGGVCIIRDDIQRMAPQRDDIVTYVVPIKDLMNQADVPSAFSKRVENMTYVGAVAQLFDIPLDMIYTSLLKNFNGKAKPAEMNFAVIQLAYDYFKENVEKVDPYRFEKMNGTAGKILITGNEAGALGAIFGGVQVVSWYPITPSTSLVDGIITYKHLRNDKETGQSTVAVIQAEDELAAAGMIIGAGFAGARSMTATSGPGISLMAEFAGLAHYAEIPCVFWDITRMGPSTGMPTRTSQGDILFTYYLGHGDSHQFCLMPGSPEEAFEFGWRAFDLAEQLQAPIFVLSDLDLGMNNWMAEPFTYPDEPVKRGKVLNAEQLQQFIGEHGSWGRYLDVDGDGVGYRTIPGTDHPMAAYFARGTGHDEYAVYSERSDTWLKNMARLKHKHYHTGRQMLPQPIIDYDESKSIGIITFGTNEPAIVEARDLLAAQGIETNYLRVRSLPLAESVLEFIKAHDRVYVIENNFDGQLHQIMKVEFAEQIANTKSLSLGDGLPMAARWIIDSILEYEG
ncbi:2-oxoacid:acceptor oxidoreductase subunit alpha [Phototrophicus methaneseepsis]|uniref:2-oxoacid:acceptor oxidoreductase subunit alpha n=1 Tax=Phototrophicus methaneseepsis TaxID=2710758 RepID=A0A7S8ID99_9CHLR|nr:2-oxoacid:acceptor oxidoreductase subunit alpha [Phototrophicus methaneseepsis]